MNNRLRIIGGLWRGRKIDFPDRPGLRPTSDRMRETLFNWLRLEVEHACCLDLFAGSGALGFEAASRGASRVVMIDSDPVALGALKQNIRLLGATQIDLIQADYSNYLRQHPREPVFDLVFLDPPFHKEMLQPACDLLAAGWLKNGARIYVETALPGLPSLPSRWQLLKTVRMGQSHCFLFQDNPPSSTF